MCRDNDLLMAVMHKPYQPSLKGCVHVNVRFVKNNCLMVLCPAQKPNHLKPHLKSVAHPCDFGGKMMILHIQGKKDRVGNLTVGFQAADTKSGPRSFRGS